MNPAIMDLALDRASDLVQNPMPQPRIEPAKPANPNNKRTKKAAAFKRWMKNMHPEIPTHE